MPTDGDTSDASVPTGDLSYTAAAAPHLTLPAFTTTDAAPWFLRIEALFRLKNVTASSKKADFVIGALPPEVFSRLSRWLVSRGTDTILYDELKAEVIRHCEPSPEEKSQKILDLLRMPLGDQRPSDALYELRNLTTVLHGDGSSSALDLTLVVWLLRLPQDIRTHITGFSRKSDLELATLADSLRGTSKLSLHTPTAAPALPHLADDDDDYDDDSPTAAAAQQRRSSSSNQRQFSGVSRKTLCYFHKRFGRDARNCRPPCFYSKNM